MQTAIKERWKVVDTRGGLGAGLLTADVKKHLHKDSLLVMNFKDQNKLEDAKNLLKKFPPPAQFTVVMGERYQKEY